MSETVSAEHVAHAISIEITINRNVASQEAILKACYWFSRDFACDINEGDHHFTVVLRPKKTPLANCESIRETFLEHVFDFELREHVNMKTQDVRNVLLAKAFAESGVLEDAPDGVFGDALEESNPNGMFKILSNG